MAAAVQQRQRQRQLCSGRQLGNGGGSLAAAAWRQHCRSGDSGSTAAAAAAAAAWPQRAAWQRQQQWRGQKKQQSTKSSGGNSDRNDIRNDLIQARMPRRLHCSRYTTFFEQSIPIWNRLSYPTSVGIQCWQKNVLIRNKYILHTYVRT